MNAQRRRTIVKELLGTRSCKRGGCTADISNAHGHAHYCGKECGRIAKLMQLRRKGTTLTQPIVKCCKWCDKPLPYGTRKQYCNDKCARERRNSGNAPTPGTVYVIANYDVKRIKVGWTRSWEQRRKSYETHSPVPLQLLSSYQGTRSDEAAIHRLLRSVKAEQWGNEWYVADTQTIWHIHDTVTDHFNTNEAWYIPR